MEKRLGTVTLGVRNLVQARRFYEQGLGYFADLDGHMWEVQFNPHLEITERGEHLMLRRASDAAGAASL